jgi:hypothetical protein
LTLFYERRPDLGSEELRKMATDFLDERHPGAQIRRRRFRLGPNSAVAMARFKGGREEALIATGEGSLKYLVLLRFDGAGGELQRRARRVVGSLRYE